jgi:hypothetical protein
MVFLPYLDVAEVAKLLSERHRAVLECRDAVAGEMGASDHGPVNLAQDHPLC